MATIMTTAFYLSEIIGRKVFLGARKLGKLHDLVIAETGKLPAVTHFVVARPFGHHALLIPWEQVEVITETEVVVRLEGIEQYEKDPARSSVLLKDYILDKKVLDLDDNEVDIVYDVKLVARNGKIYVTDVDFSRSRLLGRMGLSRLARLFSGNGKAETLSWAYVQPLPEHIGPFSGDVKLKVLKEKLSEIHPVDLADILEELDPAQRLAVFSQLETGRAASTLEEVEPRVQRDLISSVHKERAAELINSMTPAQAADILAILPAADADDILKLVDQETVSKVQFLMAKHDENILHFVTSRFIKYGPDTRVGEVLDHYAEVSREKDVIIYLYVVDEHDKLLGVVDLARLLLASAQDSLGAIMVTNVIHLDPGSTVLEASETFARYGFRALPVADETDNILGVIPYRDIMNLKHRYV
ncbi:MAG: CBS domain-containing protein [Gammaproteobacteria bacterium]|nr:CBS domain-containing protein [Gammaproteobacteria bacterium]